MAITEDASTPAVTTGTGVGVLTSAAFSPPSATLVIALVAAGYQNSPTAPSVTVADSSGGGNWTPLVSKSSTAGSFFGNVAIFTKYFAAGPGSITVAATYTNLNSGRFMAVRVLNGAAASQVGAAVASQEITPAATAWTTPITTTIAGSVVYGVCDDPVTNGTLTAAANTSLVGAPFQNTTDSVSSAACKATAATGSPGAITLGFTNGTSDTGVLALLEVLPASAGGTSIDGDPFLDPGANPSMGEGPGPFGIFGWGIPGEQTVITPPVPVLNDWTSEGGTDGVTIGTSDTGSGIRWDAVTIGTSATVQYTGSALAGKLSALYSVAATPALAFTQWNTPAAFGQWHYTGFWFRYPSTLGAAAPIFSLGVGGSPAASLRINAADKLEILDAAGVTVWTSALTMTPGQPYYASLAFFGAAAGQFQINVYDQTCAVVDSTHLLTAGLLPGVDNVKFGCVTAQTNAVWLPLILEQISYGNTRMPTPVPLQLSGPFTMRTSYLRNTQALRAPVPAGGGTPWQITPTDDSGLTDADAVTVAPAPADSAGLTDVPVVNPVHGVAPTDSAGLADVEVTTVAPAPADSAGLTDTQVWERDPSFTDSAGLTDLAVTGRVVGLAPTDDSGLSDVDAMASSTAPTDDTGLTDVPAVLSAKLILQTDDTGLTDTAAKAVAPAYTDSSGLTDAAAFTIAPAPTDSAGLTDVPAVVRSAVLVDDSGLTDVSAVSPTHILAQADDTGLTDATAFAYSPAPVDSSGLTDSDAVTVAPVYVDSSGLTDTSTVAPTHIVVTTDDSGLTDTEATTRTEFPSDDSGLTDVTAVTRAPIPTDDTGLTDTATVIPAHVVIQSDDTGLTDIPGITHAAVLTDDSGLTDADAIRVSQVPTDDSGLSDAATATRTAAPSDSAGLTDTATMFSAKLLLPVDDSGLTDTSLLTRALAPVDDSGLTDAPVLTRAAVIADSAGLTDVPLVVPTHVVAQTDDSGLTDTSTITRQLTPQDSAGLTDTTATTRAAVAADDSGLTDVPVVSAVHVQAIVDSAGLSDTATEVMGRAQAIVDSAGLADFITSLRSSSIVDDSGLTDVPGVTPLSGSRPGNLASGDTLAGTVQTGLATATLTSSDRGAAGS